MTTQPFVLRWGILSTGAISSRFAKDLLIDPAPRSAADIQHRITAVASRNDSGNGVQKAQSFIDTHLSNAEYKSQIKPLPTYEDLYKDADVDVIYIGTPHSHHYRNAKDALLAGKPVLLEKPSTVNAKQLKELVDIARKQKVFFMEAVWTRFFPITYEVQKLIQSNAIGTVRFVEAEFASSFDIAGNSPEHRMLDPKLAGGAVLDQGAYAWTWLTLTCQHPLNLKDKQAPLPVPKIAATQVLSNPELTKHLGGQIDESSVATWKWPAPNGKPGEEAMVYFKTSLKAKTPSERTCLITGSKGHIQITFPPYRPTTYIITQWKDEQSITKNEKPIHEERKEFDFPGGLFGLVWEADEVARCIRDKKLESERMPLNESVQMMEVLDEIRKQGGLVYPSEIESVDA